MVESNLEKFLPALIGLIGRVAGAAGGGEEEEEKAMDKQHTENALQKLMKHYPGDEGYDTGHEQHQQERWDYIRGTDPPERNCLFIQGWAIWGSRL